MSSTARPRQPPRSADGDPELDVFRCALDGIQLIEASAGTGKTWAICGLVLRLLLERGLEVQQVLVVTFTEAATAELRERIRGRLAEVLAALQPAAPRPADPFIVGLLGRLRQLPDHDEARLLQRLQAALHGFDEAAIHTIHGWCQRALADTPFSAGLPMAQEVLHDDSALRDAAVRQAWRAEVSQRPLPEPLAALLLARKDTPQSWSQLLRRLLGRPLAERRWPAAIEGQAELPATDTQALQQAHAALARRWGEERALILGRLQAALAAGDLKANMVRPDGLLAGAAAWDALLGGADPLRPLDKDAAAKALLFTRDKLASATKSGRTPPTDDFFDAAGALLALRAEAELQLGLARAWLMRRVLERAEAALRRHKRAEGLVAFDDMLFNLHQALHDEARPQRAQALAAALRARFPAALIDEFQDTDPLQFAIFRRLYGPAAAADDAARAADPAMFLVGDPKQAIYSFRNADLPTYLSARALADAAHCLAHNQRSVPALIEGLNRLFGHHPLPFMQAGLAYRAVGVGPKRRSELVDHSAPGERASHAALQLWHIPDDPADGAPPLRAQAHAQALQATAAEIARLLGEARHARITLGGRPLRAGDIAVLVRSHRHGGEVRQALAARGIGSVELSQASVYRSPDAEALAWVLHAVLQPGRERLLRAALATELFGRSASELDAAAHDPAGLTDEMLRFADHLAVWRERGIAVMLRRMLATEQIAARLLRQPQGERRLTNWLHLAECLHEAEASHRAPAALLRWFERQRSDEAITEASQLRLESDQNLVQIVTVHKSKGLEYPLVFCPFLWTPSAPPPSTQELLAYPDEGASGSTMVLDFRARLDEACDPKALRPRIALDAAAEELRLIYVALTRAVHRCHLVVGCSARGTATGRSPKSGTPTPLNWLVAGGGIDPGDWIAGSAELTPAAVMAAWRALADQAQTDAGGRAAPTAGSGPAAASASASTPGTGSASGSRSGSAPTPAVSLRGLDEVIAQAASAPSAPAHEPPALQALPPPARLPAGWTIGSYSQLSRGRLPADIAASGARSGPVGGLSLAVSGAVGGLSATTPGRLADDLSSDPASDDFGDQLAIDHDALAETARDDGAGAPALPGGPDDDPAPSSGPAAPWDADDILRFPRGGSAGECVHQVFERADFGQPAQWPAVIDAALDGLPGTDASNRPARAAMLLRMLREVCAAPLLPSAPGQAPLRLGELPTSRRLNELEFHLSAPALSAAALNTALADHGYPVPPLAFGQLQGFLRGFIDLVFEHGGRWYVLDWKSNHLGTRPADYGPEACARAMADQGYHLQALLYALALQRLLALRLPGYRHEVHFGGVAYVFVRGFRTGWADAQGRPCGLYLDRPSAEALGRLDALFQGGPR